MADAAWVALAPLSLGAALGGCLVVVQALGRRPLALALALAAAWLVTLEAVGVHGLSALGALGRPGLLAVNAAIASPLLRGLPRRPRRRAVPDPAILALLLLAVLAALAFRPNTLSVPYHLARVVYWLARRAVWAFPTFNDLQVDLPPGAEYLQLSLQAIAGSDRWANLPAWAAYAGAVAAAGPLARSFGASGGARKLAALAVASLPMALLQASSPANDLPAALSAIAVVAASLTCRRGHPGDRLALLVALSAAALIKPTALIAALPFAAWAAVDAWRRHRNRFRAVELLGLLLPALALGPYVATSWQTPGAAETRAAYVYAGLEDPGDRLLNLLRLALRQLPVPLPLTDRLAPAPLDRLTPGCAQRGSLCLRSNFALSEDESGNPLAFALALVAAGQLWRRRGRAGRVRSAAIAWWGGWVLFGLLLRDNVWITRLTLPSLALIPVLLGGLPLALSRRGWPASLLAAGLLAHGALAVALNDRRPLTPSAVAHGHDVSAYYPPPLEALEARDGAVLAALSQLPACRQLGLSLAWDAYDYPLAWRAALQGWEVRPLVADGPGDQPAGDPAALAWPCAIYSEEGPPAGDGWRPGGAAGLYLR